MIAKQKASLKSIVEMFDGKFEHAVVETMLSLNNWQVNETIDQLMSISDNGDNSVVDASCDIKGEIYHQQQNPDNSNISQFNTTSSSFSYANIASKSSPISTKLVSESKYSPRYKVDNRKRTLESVERVKNLVKDDIKVMIILRGCSGSGKSTLARKILNECGIVENEFYFVHSADNYFYSGNFGKYIFDNTLIPNAHFWNECNVKDTVNAGLTPIIIDNTNSISDHMLPFIKIAVNNGYNIEIIEPDTPWLFEPYKLVRKNCHGTPLHTIKNMVKNYERNVTVSDLMKRYMLSYPTTCIPPQKGVRSLSNEKIKIKLDELHYHVVGSSFLMPLGKENDNISLKNSQTNSSEKKNEFEENFGECKVKNGINRVNKKYKYNVKNNINNETINEVYLKRNYEKQMYGTNGEDISVFGICTNNFENQINSIDKTKPTVSEESNFKIQIVDEDLIAFGEYNNVESKTAINGKINENQFESKLFGTPCKSSSDNGSSNHFINDVNPEDFTDDIFIKQWCNSNTQDFNILSELKSQSDMIKQKNNKNPNVGIINDVDLTSTYKKNVNGVNVEKYIINKNTVIDNQNNSNNNICVSDLTYCHAPTKSPVVTELPFGPICSSENNGSNIEEYNISRSLIKTSLSKENIHHSFTEFQTFTLNEDLKKEHNKEDSISVTKNILDNTTPIENSKKAIIDKNVFDEWPEWEATEDFVNQDLNEAMLPPRNSNYKIVPKNLFYINETNNYSKPMNSEESKVPVNSIFCTSNMNGKDKYTNTGFDDDTFVQIVKDAYSRDINYGYNSPNSVIIEQNYKRNKGTMTVSDPCAIKEKPVDNTLIKLFPDIATIIMDLYEKCAGNIDWVLDILIEGGHCLSTEQVDYLTSLQNKEQINNSLEELELSVMREAKGKESTELLQSAKKVNKKRNRINKKRKNGKNSDTEPTEINLNIEIMENAVSGVDSVSSSDSEDISSEFSSNNEEVFELSLDRSTVSKLMARYGNPTIYSDKDYQPIVKVPTNLAQQLHAFLIGSIIDQAEEQECLINKLIEEDKDMSINVQNSYEAISTTDFMEVENGLNHLLKNSNNYPCIGETNKDTSDSRFKYRCEDTFASKCSLALLTGSFPSLSKEFVKNTFKKQNFNYYDTKNVLNQYGKEVNTENESAIEIPSEVEKYDRPLIFTRQRDISTTDVTSQVNECRINAAANELECQKYHNNLKKALQEKKFGAAAYYREIMNAYKEESKENNAQAAAILVNSSCAENASVIDLHFFKVADAVASLEKFLDFHIQKLINSGKKKARLYIITGRGASNKAKVSRLQPPVKSHLSKRFVS